TCNRYMFRRGNTNRLEDFFVIHVLLARIRSTDPRIRYLAWQYWVLIAQRMRNLHGRSKLLPPICYCIDNTLKGSMELASRTGKPEMLKTTLSGLSDLELLIAYYYCLP